MSWINNNVLNSQASPAIYADILANIPTYNLTGMLFVSTDTFALYRNNGSTFVLIGGPGTGTITGSGTIGTLPKFTGTAVLGNSLITETTGQITVNGNLLSTGNVVNGEYASVGNVSYQIRSFKALFLITCNGTTSAGGTTVTYYSNTGGQGSLFFETGTATVLTLGPTGVITMANLAGSGNRIVEASATGVLSATNAATGFYVPYTGATTNVDLGIYTITAGSANINGLLAIVSNSKSYIKSSNNANGSYQIGNTVTGGEASMLFIGGNATSIGNTTPTSSDGNSALWIIGSSTFSAGVTNFGIGNLNLQRNIITLASTGEATFYSTVTASSYIIPLGTAAQLLAANGSVVTAGTNITITSGTISTTAPGGVTTNALTFATTGGVIPTSTFNGSAAVTIDYSSVGASPLAGSSSLITVGTITTGTWNAGSITALGSSQITGTDRVLTLTNLVTDANCLLRFASNAVNKYTIGFNNTSLIFFDDVASAYRLTITSTGVANFANRVNINGATDDATFQLNNSNSVLNTGGVSFQGQTVSTSTTVTRNRFLWVYDGPIGETLTLPAALGNNSLFLFKNNTAVTVTIACSGADTIQTLAGTTPASVVLAANQVLYIISNGLANYVQII
jgi:hypothetical protein